MGAFDGLPALRRFKDSCKEGFSELLWPSRCVGCDLPGTLLCPDCQAQLPRIDPATACPHCGAPAGELVCSECDPAKPQGGFRFSAARAYGSFSGALAQMLVLYKDEGERRLAPIIARLLCITANADWRAWAQAIVFVPAAPKAYRRRGFDHMEEVARAMSEQCGIPLCDVLIREDSKDQRQLNKAERRQNAAGSFSLQAYEASLLADKNVILIDDVFTTGATLDAAAGALLDAGVRGVRVVVAARVW